MDVIDEIIGRDFYRLHQLKAAGFRPESIVDIGAHIRVFAVFAHALWPDARILCVEPNPESFNLLQRNAPFAISVNAAIRYDGANILTDADRATGAGFMTTSASFENSAAVKRNQDGFEYRVAFEDIPLRTFEQVCDAASIERIDLLKLDCEGSEIHLFQNMDQNRSQRIRFVLGEYHIESGFAGFKSLAEERLPHLEFFGGSEAEIGPFWSRHRVGQVFKHSGDLGDIIYSLPAMRALGGGWLSLYRTEGTRQAMSQSIRDLLPPLLELQPYIDGVELADPHLPIHHDLDRFRDYWKANAFFANSIANYHLATFALDPDELNHQWLRVDEPVELLDLPVVVSRSARHHNARFPWRKVVQKYRGKMVFVGTEEEHQDFCELFGPVPYHPTSDLLELARVIAGSKLFIGNQSCPYAIAEGLKVRTIQEVYLRDPNCIFPRGDAMYVWTQNVDLPDLD